MLGRLDTITGRVLRLLSRPHSIPGTGAQRGLRPCHLHVCRSYGYAVSRRQPRSIRSLSHLAQAFHLGYRFGLVSSHFSRTPVPFGLTTTGGMSSRSLITRLHRRSLCLRERLIWCIGCTLAHYPRRSMLSPRCARFGRRVSSSVAAPPKRVWSLPRCRFGGFAG